MCSQPRNMFSAVWVVVPTYTIQFFMFRRALLPEVSNINTCLGQNQISLLFGHTCMKIMSCSQINLPVKISKTLRNTQNLPKYAKLRKLQKIRVLSRKLFKGGSTNPPKKCFFGIAGKKCVSRKKRITSIWAWTAYKRKKHAFWHIFSHYSPLETGTGHMGKFG